MLVAPVCACVSHMSQDMQLTENKQLQTPSAHGNTHTQNLSEAVWFSVDPGSICGLHSEEPKETWWLETHLNVRHFLWGERGRGQWVGAGGRPGVRGLAGRGRGALQVLRVGMVVRGEVCVLAALLLLWRLQGWVGGLDAVLSHGCTLESHRSRLEGPTAGAHLLRVQKLLLATLTHRGFMEPCKKERDAHISHESVWEIELFTPEGLVLKTKTENHVESNHVSCLASSKKDDHFIYVV